MWTQQMRRHIQNQYLIDKIILLLNQQIMLVMIIQEATQDNNIYHIDNRHDDAEDSFWNNNTEDTKVMIKTSNRNLVKTSINNKEITNNTSNNIDNAPIFLSQQNMPQNMPQPNIQQQPISPQMMNNAINNKSSSTKKSSILPSTGKDWLMFIVVLLGLILIGKYGYDKHLKAKAEHH